MMAYGFKFEDVMNKSILGLCLMLAITPVLAAEIVMDGFKPWTLITGNEQGADTVDLSQVQKGPDVRRAMGAHYFAETMQFSVTENGRPVNKQVDFIISSNDYDCRRAGTYRLRNEEYYSLQATDRTYYRNYVAEGATKWNVVGRDKPQYAIWQVLCKDAVPNGMIDLGKLTGKNRNIYHSEVLNLIRAQIQQEKLQKMQRPVTSQPVR